MRQLVRFQHMRTISEIWDYDFRNMSSKRVRLLWLIVYIAISEIWERLILGGLLLLWVLLLLLLWSVVRSRNISSIILKHMCITAITSAITLSTLMTSYSHNRYHVYAFIHQQYPCNNVNIRLLLLISNCYC